MFWIKVNWMDNLIGKIILYDVKNIGKIGLGYFSKINWLIIYKVKVVN